MSKRNEAGPNEAGRRVGKTDEPVEEPVEEGAEVEAHRLENERSRLEGDNRTEGERSRRRTET